MSGLDFLTLIRKDKNQIPVLLLTARDAVRHRVEGLNAGADDYLVKPFDLDELLARCAALVRRAQGHAEPVIVVLDIQFEPASGKLEKTAKRLFCPHANGRFSMSSFTILTDQSARPKLKNVFTTASSEEIESNTIEVHIAALRRKLGRELIKTIRGVGYMITK